MEQKEKHIIDQLNKREGVLPNADYFEQLKKNVFIAAEIDTTVKVVPFYKSWFTYVAAAASILLIFSLVFWGENEAEITKVKLDLSGISKSELLDYIHENREDFDIETLVSLSDSLPELQHKSVQIEPQETTADLTKKSEKSPFDQLDKNEILDYLDENAIDIDEEIIYGT